MLTRNATTDAVLPQVTGVIVHVNASFTAGDSAAGKRGALQQRVFNTTWLPQLFKSMMGLDNVTVTASPTSGLQDSRAAVPGVRALQTSTASSHTSQLA
jgi:hypothetical protein